MRGQTLLTDAHQRTLTYLRLSVTDRCNLRCRYCMPHGVQQKLEHGEILSYEEYLELIRILAAEGIQKVRITGGEPLIRKGLLGFLWRLHDRFGHLDLRLTTNGVFLAELAPDLLAAGIRRVNVSLDSLDPKVFAQITGENVLPRVLEGIDTALRLGFERVKLNVVAIRGLNDREILDFARLSLDRPLEVRFIEYMPLGTVGFWSRERFLPSAEIRGRLTELGPLQPLAAEAHDGPAVRFRLPGAMGAIGLISPVTEHFCARCDRLRLTADGKLRLCLLSNQEVDLKTPLRAHTPPEALADLIRRAILDKPARHHLDQPFSCVSNRAMYRIGG